MNNSQLRRCAIDATVCMCIFVCSGLAVGAEGGAFDSDGITLRSWLPLGDFPGGQSSANDIWGYVSPSGREYAIVGLRGGTAFVEVTNPSAATLIDYVPTPGGASIWRDMRTYEEYAYSVSEDGFGMEVIDLSDIDNGSVELVNLVNDNATFSAHNVSVNEDSGYAYLVGTNNALGFVVVDLSDPANPVIGESWTLSDFHDLQAVSYVDGPYAGREIVFGFGGWSSDLWIIDVTDKSDMVVLSRTDYPNAEYCHQGWLSPDRQLLYTNDELDELNNDDITTTTTHVFDVRNLENPVHVRTFSNGQTSIDHNLMTRGRYVIQANYTSGLRIFDVCDLFSAHEVAYFDTHPESNNPEFEGAWGVYSDLPSGIILVSDINRGLFVLETDIDLVQENIPEVLYVNKKALTTGDGSSWGEALTDLQEAIEMAKCTSGAITEIRVAAGVYKPDGGSGSQPATFDLVSGLSIYGGFAGNEALLEDRDPEANLTVLSGDLAGDDGEGFANTGENSFNVVGGVDLDATTLLDGFTIIGGNTSTSGAGIKLTNSSLTIRRCRIVGNQAQRGAGTYLSDGSNATFEQCVFEGNAAGINGGGGESVGSNPTLTDCIFRNNAAGSGGGGFAASFGDASFVRCVFEQNVANFGGGLNNATGDAIVERCKFLLNIASVFGGGMYNLQGNPRIEDSLFVGNLADSGGGMYSRFDSAPVVLNATLFGNQASGVGGGMFHADSTPDIRSSVLWGNSDASDSLESGQIFFDDDVDGGINYSCVEGWLGLIGGVGMIGDDPMFRDEIGDDGVFASGDEDLRLSSGSPSVNTGDEDALSLGADLDGHARILCDRIDMGAFESGIGDGDCDGDVDLSDFGTLQVCFGTTDAVDECLNYDTDLDGTIDIADFAEFISAAK